MMCSTAIGPKYHVILQLATCGCACDMETMIGYCRGSQTWSVYDWYMYVKGELNQHNCFGMVHASTAYSQKDLKSISNSL